MKIILPAISLLALIMTIIPSVLFLSGTVELDRVKALMLITTLIWFVVTPCWMGRETKKAG